jgi:hypothetical protein
MTLEERIKELQTIGMFVGARDPNLNQAFSGRYMVAEPYEPGTVTEAASNGPWCIVGDDLAELVNDAFNAWFG